MKKMTKKYLCILLCGMLMLSAFPSSQVHAVEVNGQEADLDDASDILSLDSEKPKELDQYPDNVYDVDKGQPFLLSEQNELMLIVGAKNSEGEGKFTVSRLDTMNLDLVRKEGDECWTNGVNYANAESYDQALSKDNPCRYLGCIQSIGFDRDGTGRKQYVASVGINGRTHMLEAVIQNAVTGDITPLSIETVSEVDSAQYWTKDNYLAITAGDYDGDGRESVVIYVSGNTFNAGDGFIGLKEISFSEDGEATISEVVDFRTSFVRTAWQMAMRYRSEIQYRPVVSLATGDFTGDGRDQIAFTIGFYNPTDNIRDGYESQLLTSSDLGEFAMTAAGVCSRTSSKWKCSDRIEFIDQSSDFTLSGIYRKYPLASLHAGVLAAGDVNNDGVDEIVVCGYTSLTEEDSTEKYAKIIYKDGKPYEISHLGDFSRKKLAVSVVSYDGSDYSRTPISYIDMPQAMAYTFKNYCDDQDWVFTKNCLACAKTNGANAPEKVFINGMIYDFKDLVPKEVLKPAFLASNDLDQLTFLPNTMNAFSSSVNWVRNVSVGNFNGNEAGREQFVYTFWQKWEGQNSYNALVGVTAGVEYDDKTDDKDNIVKYGPPKYYGSSIDVRKLYSVLTYDSVYSTNAKDACKAFMLCSDLSEHGLNAVPVAIDIDEDGITGRFSKSGYVYTDPEVLAVLEAGPYFAELEEAGGYEDPCETTYSISTGFGTGTSHGDNVSFEVGVCSEVSGGPVKVGLEAGYTMDWSHTFESSYKITTTSEFTAQSEDVVVIHRVPELIYTYDIWDAPNKTWIENGMNVRVPLTPKYYTLSVDDYNEFVDEYNALLKPQDPYALKKIVKGKDLPKNHEGNPANYWKSWSSAGKDGTKLSKSDYSLSYSSGHMSCEYEAEAEKTESEEIAHGFHFGLTVQAGANFVVGEAWAGGYANVDYNSSTGHSTTTVDTKKSGGQVQNIKAKAVEGLSASQVKSGYGFDWNFGKWTRVLTTEGTKVPFYGYTVFNVKRRALPPKLDNESKTVTYGYKAFTVKNLTSGLKSGLTVTKVSGSSKITYDSEAKAIKVAAGLKPGTYKAVFKISNGLVKRDTKFSYTVIVAKAPLAEAQVTTSKASYTYTGKARRPNPTVILNGKTLTKDTDYTVSYKNNTSVGTATITITGIGNYTGTAKKTFKIVKAKQPMTVTAKTATVQFSAVKTKKQVLDLSKTMTIKKAQGKTTFAKVTKGSSKYLTVNADTGKITVAKNTPKGTYTIKVKVTAAGNKNYLKGSKTVTVKIKVA